MRGCGSCAHAAVFLLSAPQTRAYITNLKANPETGVLYPACPLPAENAAQAGRTCQKKLRFDQSNNSWCVARAGGVLRLRCACRR